MGEGLLVIYSWIAPFSSSRASFPEVEEVKWDARVKVSLIIRNGKLSYEGLLLKWGFSSIGRDLSVDSGPTATCSLPLQAPSLNSHRITHSWFIWIFQLRVGSALRRVVMQRKTSKFMKISQLHRKKLFELEANSKRSENRFNNKTATASLTAEMKIEFPPPPHVWLSRVSVEWESGSEKNLRASILN